jgi:hypothetical protein
VAIGEPTNRTPAAPTPAAGDLLEHILQAETAAEGGTGARSGTRLVSGHLAGVDGDDRLLFRPDGWDDAPLPVAIGTSHSDDELLQAARGRRRAIVAVADHATPVLVSIVRERLGSRPGAPSAGTVGVRSDGETVEVRAEQQIELRCGKASLILRADGRVVLSGTYVVSTSRGPNKIRGATVTLN